ncbi:hypothetical protein B0H14DRAFT_2573694 [Mycena olivaceomarginata]|nr:hypothetical protein B0H14DRAFT_2573694 [Mycena olivaceomarginata]
MARTDRRSAPGGWRHRIGGADAWQTLGIAWNGGAVTLALGFRDQDLTRIKTHRWRTGWAEEAPYLAREASAPYSNNGGAARHDAHTPQDLRVQGELVLSTTRTGTAGGGSRAVPAREESLTVVIDATIRARAAATGGAEPGDARTPPAGARAQLHTNSTRDPTAHAPRRTPLSFSHAADDRKIEFFEGEERDGTHRGPTELISEGLTGPDRFGVASAQAEVPIGDNQSSSDGDVGRRPDDHETDEDSCDGGQAATERETQERGPEPQQPLSRDRVSRGAMSFTGGNAGAHNHYVLSQTQVLFFLVTPRRYGHHPTAGKR